MSCKGCSDSTDVLNEIARPRQSLEYESIIANREKGQALVEYDPSCATKAK